MRLTLVGRGTCSPRSILLRFEALMLVFSARSRSDIARRMRVNSITSFLNVRASSLMASSCPTWGLVPRNDNTTSLPLQERRVPPHVAHLHDSSPIFDNRRGTEYYSRSTDAARTVAIETLTKGSRVFSHVLPEQNPG